MRSRVMPGSSPTMERRLPRIALKRVDFPTFGRPTMTTAGSGSSAAISFTGSHTAELGPSSVPVAQGTRTRERQEFLHKVVSGVTAEAHDRAHQAICHRTRAGRLPHICKLAAGKLAEHLSVCK